MRKPLASIILSILILSIFCPAASAQIKNFNSEGKQVTRFSTLGDAVDAHDGEIAYFDGTYYLYGTSYDCGFQWGNKTAPFCGFKSYSSKDMVNWTDRGPLFDATTPIWQSRCDGKTYGCFRPHVIFNKKTKLYVLWINVYDNVVGYRVFTSKTPVGPFSEVAEPHLVVNSDMPAAGLNNGDHDTFIDDDGTAYLAYTDWRTKGTIVIEKLSADYLTGTGEVVKGVTEGETEAPGLFKRKGIYYVVYSDPNCGYCSGTGTSYRTAKSPLGPWSKPTKISDNSCGGQPSFVSTLKVNNETIYLYGSDLWNNAAKNEALANFYWAPLTFTIEGAINPLQCAVEYTMPRAAPDSKTKPSANDDWLLKCDIGGQVQRSQIFKPLRSTLLGNLSVTIFQNNKPNAPLVIEIYKAGANHLAMGKGLASKSIPVEEIGWSARNIFIAPNIRIAKGQEYVIVLKSATTAGCYGFAYNEAKTVSVSAALSTDGGKTFVPEEGRKLKFEILIK
ncbi:family 43 glycosylhydrolase [Mucilaginibacter sp.]|uniref:family 43 glycosylhydrolase n=1 Tax=Mucilaginibacter sp. TaxID=1882438 RepID=UPI003262EB27